MKLYELTCLLLSKLTPEEINNFSERIISFIQEKNGILVENPLTKERIVKKRLAFPIKKEAQGYLKILSFYFPPQEIAALKVKLDSEDQILRYVILAKKAVKELKIPKVLFPVPKKEKEARPLAEKVNLKEIEKKLEEILGE